MRTTPDLLLEVGCEELPAAACREAESQLPQLAAKALADAGLEAAEIHVHVAPRRLVVCALGVPAERPAVRREQRGPKVDAPEQARAGFARKHGVAPGELEERDGFLWVTTEEPATPAAELLREIVPAVVGRIQFSKTMRWDGGRFSRPVRWLVCKLDEQPVDVELFGVRSGVESRGHRFLGGEARIASASTYLEDVRGVRVVADAAERRELITEGLDQGGEWIDPMDKLAEVTYLVEWPVVLEGSFDERYLLLPPRVPITAMQSHQRYFPVAGEGGGLAPRFLFVANGAAKPEIVIAGNEEVLVGRLEDASFAYERDLDRGIEAMLAELGRVSFLEGGGSLADKTARVGELAEPLCDRNEAGEDVRIAVLRAAELCKADLVSRLVSEFSDLQGYAGSVYARQAGEPDQVCAAVEEHYMPVDAGGALPVGEAGALLSVADKVDTVAVAFALGHQPTGSRDPYGLRRAAAGTVAIVLERGYELGLPDLLGMSVAGLVRQGLELKRKPLEAVPDAVEFILDRVEPVLLTEGVTVEEVRAARGAGHVAPVPLAALARALRDDRGSPRLESLRDAYGRCTRIVTKSEDELAVNFDELLLSDPAEHQLLAALRAADESLADCVARRDYPCALATAADLVGPVNEFFEKVLVMDPDPAVRSNRLKLVFNVAAALRSVGDLDRLPG